jgi:hypothetical protein
MDREGSVLERDYGPQDLETHLVANKRLRFIAPAMHSTSRRLVLLLLDE